MYIPSSCCAFNSYRIQGGDELICDVVSFVFGQSSPVWHGLEYHTGLSSTQDPALASFDSAVVVFRRRDSVSVDKCTASNHLHRLLRNKELNHFPAVNTTGPLFSSLYMKDAGDTEFTQAVSAIDIVMAVQIPYC
jgi:hypothetical protein